MKKSFLVLFILLFTFQAFAAGVTLQWDANPPEDQAQGYIVYCTDGVGFWNNNAGNVTEYTVQNLTPGYTPVENPKGEIIILLPEKVTITIQ